MSARVDDVITRVPNMRATELREWQSKAQRVLAKQPDDLDARRLLNAIEGRLAQSDAERRIPVGGIDWEPYSIAGCDGFVGNVRVARIFVHATHTNAHKEVYSVEVQGEQLTTRYQYIDDAREAASQAYQQQRSSHVRRI